MKAKLLPFIPAERVTAVCDAPRVVHFLTRRDFDRREFERLWAAHERWVLRKWALPPGAPIEEPPCTDIMLCTLVERELRLRRLQRHVGETVLRTPAPHPIVRIVGWSRRLVSRVVDGLQIAILAFYALLGLTAFPLLANAHWLGGLTMAMIGTVFGWLLLVRCNVGDIRLQSAEVERERSVLR
jgi:hypothetical protein